MNPLQAIDIAYNSGQRPHDGRPGLQSPTLFAQAECESLIAELSANTQPGRVGDGSVRPERYHASDAFIDPRPIMGPLKTLIDYAEHRFVLPSLTLRESARFIRYGSGGHFDWHRDNNGTNHRRLTISLQLSQPDEYLGGDLIVIDKKGNWTCADRAQGCACLFPARYAHKVTPVISGSRASIVIWLD